VILTGDTLLATLKEHGCRLVIHGHKHLARIRKVDDVVVLAAGSFSAMMNEAGSPMGNMFHTIELQEEGSSPQNLCGAIRTWTFQLGTGWIKSAQRFCGFPFRTGFGGRSSAQALINAVSALADAAPGPTVIAESEVLKAAPDLMFTLPDEFAHVISGLRALGLKFYDYDDGCFHLGKVI
jgi:hypothetical protein